MATFHSMKELHIGKHPELTDLELHNKEKCHFRYEYVLDMFCLPLTLLAPVSW